MSDTSIPRPVSTDSSSDPKSSPTGPTTRTSLKKLAASEKCTAEPPSMRSRSPNGVRTASKAIDPTTTRLIGGGSLVDQGTKTPCTANSSLSAVSAPPSGPPSNTLIWSSCQIVRRPSLIVGTPASNVVLSEQVDPTLVSGVAVHGSETGK